MSAPPVACAVVPCCAATTHGDACVWMVALDRRAAAVERLRATLTADERERAAIRRLAPELRHEEFFNCSTRKESYIEGTGEGPAHPLDRFSVSLVLGMPARLECVADDSTEAKAWTLEALAPSPGYTAAVIVEGHPERIVCQTWPEDVR